MKSLSAGWLVAFLWFAGLAAQALADVDSGPKTGDPVPPLKVTVVVGDDQGKEIDLAKAREEKPTVYCFVPADRFSRPIARTMKKLDGEIDKFGQGARLVAVWLTDDAKKSSDYLPKLQQSLKFDAATLAVYPSMSTGPEGWALHSDADLTVVVATDKRTLASFGFVGPNDTVVKQVLEAIHKAKEK